MHYSCQVFCHSNEICSTHQHWQRHQLWCRVIPKGNPTCEPPSQLRKGETKWQADSHTQHKGCGISKGNVTFWLKRFMSQGTDQKNKRVFSIKNLLTFNYQNWYRQLPSNKCRRDTFLDVKHEIRTTPTDCTMWGHAKGTEKLNEVK